MNNRMYDRDRYDDRNDYRRRYEDDRNRDWGERATDEVRSWFGDDDAERRRRMDERHNDRYDYDDDRTYRTTSSYRNYDRDYDRSNYGGYGRDYNREGNWGYNDRNMGTRQLEGYGYTDRYNSRDYDDHTWRNRDNYDRDRNDRGDRGFFQRAGDEVRSWFGDDDAERRRRMDEQRDDRYDRYNDNRYAGRYRSDDDDRNWW
jgi:osmotically-inducible protein OsmY